MHGDVILERSCAFYGSAAVANMVCTVAATAIRRSYYASGFAIHKPADVEKLSIGDVVFCRAATGETAVSAIAMVSSQPSQGMVSLILLDVLASKGDREYVTGDLVMANGDEIFQ